MFPLTAADLTATCTHCPGLVEQIAVFARHPGHPSSFLPTPDHYRLSSSELVASLLTHTFQSLCPCSTWQSLLPGAEKWVPKFSSIVRTRCLFPWELAVRERIQLCQCYSSARRRLPKLLEEHVGEVALICRTMQH